MTLVQTLFGFQGRIRRRDWWLWSIATAVAYLAFVVVAAMVVFGDAWSTAAFYDAALDPGLTAALIFSILTQIPFLWVQLALAIKRAHDRDRGAGVIAFLVVATGAASYVPAEAAGRAFDQGAVLGLVFLAIAAFNLIAGLYLLIVLGFLDGTPGPNRFGPSPKGIGGDLPTETAKVFE